MLYVVELGDGQRVITEAPEEVIRDAEILLGTNNERIAKELLGDE